MSELKRNFEVKVRNEAGHEQALEGMSYSHGLHLKEMDHEEKEERKKTVALNLAPKDMGHNKFLESIIIWIYVRGPWYWWKHADTYRISSKQSESSMHTILNRPISTHDFGIDDDIPPAYIAHLNELVEDKEFERLINRLPNGYMQRRMWCMSYKTLKNLVQQRKHHKLKEWYLFMDAVLSGIEHPEYIATEEDRKAIHEEAVA